MTDSDVEDWTWDAIRKTIHKFRTYPDYFFTESDITSYLWKSLYTEKLEVSVHDRKIQCVHREYPTNFRYEKKNLLKSESLAELIDRVGTRGNYDLVVLNPAFVQNSTGFDHIPNKSVRRLEERFDPAAIELLFAVELKYVITNARAWEEQIKLDNRKLQYATRNKVRHAVNLVFCNTDHENVKRFQQAVEEADANVLAIFVQSYWDKKPPVKVRWNTTYNGCGIDKLKLQR